MALAEMALAGGIGFEYEELEIEELTKRRYPSQALFGELGAGFLVSVPEDRWTELEDALDCYEEGKPGIGYDVVGRTGGTGSKSGT